MTGKVEEEELPTAGVASESVDRQLAFERLISDLSAILAGATGREWDDELLGALDLLGRALDVDRAQVASLSDSGNFKVTHTWAAYGVDEIAVGTLMRVLPRAQQMLLRGEIFQFSALEELEDSFPVEHRLFSEVHTQAHLSLPIKIHDRLVGVLTFGSLRPTPWPPELVERLEVVARIIGNAQRRHAVELELSSAVSELEALKTRFIAESRYLHGEIRDQGRYGKIVGESGRMVHVLHQVRQVAPTDATVLIIGATGTGKELVARALHHESARSQRPLVKVNCAALPTGLIESELFGHERGAFTGASKRKIGRFELADHGTIFLDEVGDLPLELQPKLLRVLQDGEFERIGSNETLITDVRVIAATNHDLEEAIDRGSFRADLYYRLRVVPIELPPLRDRRDDIPLLVWHFVEHFGARQGKIIRDIPHALHQALVSYDWPGNVRELANVIERAVILSSGETLVVDEAFARVPGLRREDGRDEDLTTVERAHIIEVLERCGWKIKGRGNAAERLGLNPSTLRARMKKLGIERPARS